MYREHYSRFLATDPERLHFAAHSHHLWPDVTRAAQIQYWDDSARLIDDKWSYIFSEIIPQAQRSIAEILDLSSPQNIAFAPATHDFVVRILSNFDQGKPLRVLTTDSEFYSFARQISRYEELPAVMVTRISLQPFEDFEERFIDAATKGEFELIYVSHVFFNSSYYFRGIEKLIAALKSNDTIIVIDGYHSFMALPVSLRKIEKRVFYTAGGYKYAQSGEAVCFLHCPPGYLSRPLNTGWFATFGSLESRPAQSSKETPFSLDGFRFFGGTFDPVGVYRFNAVAKWMRDNNFSVAAFDSYIKELQQYFLCKLEEGSILRRGELLLHSLERHGHFFAFNTPRAKQLKEALHAKKVITDLRGDIIRFGFGIYQSKAEIDLLFERARDLRGVG